jgi:hypothetical protein
MKIIQENGACVAAFREACQRLGLLEHDEHWDTSEALLSCVPAQEGICHYFNNLRAVKSKTSMGQI